MSWPSGTWPIGAWPKMGTWPTTTQPSPNWPPTGGTPGTAPTFTADNPPGGTVNTPYTYTFTATGSPAPTFAVTSGSLPAGLSLNGTTGVLSGTPTASGTSTFKVTATNGVAPDAVSPTITMIVAGNIARVVASDGKDHAPSCTFGIQNGVGSYHAPTAGNVILCAIICLAAENPTLTGFSILTSQASASVKAVLFGKISDGTEHTLTPANATSSYRACCEIAGLQNPLATDGTGGTFSNSATSLATASITTTHAADYIFTVAVDGANSAVWTTATTILDEISFTGGYSGEHIVATTQTGYTDTATPGGAAGEMITLIAAFKGI